MLRFTRRRVKARIVEWTKDEKKAGSVPLNVKRHLSHVTRQMDLSNDPVTKCHICTVLRVILG